jgi:RHS repeat-associated protein
LTGNAENEKLQYNAANRLSRRTVTDINGILIKATDYLYNAQGQRTRKIHHQQNGVSTITLYHYNLEGQLISESNELATGIIDYVWHNLRPVAQIDHDQQAANDEIYYLHTDHLFTPRFATDKNKQIIWRWQGEAFGETEAENDVDGDAIVTTINLRFPGQYYDEESGNHYNNFRDYDPDTGRYIMADPIGQSGGINLYSYVRNNPLIYIDPYGLFLCSLLHNLDGLTIDLNAGIGAGLGISGGLSLSSSGISSDITAGTGIGLGASAGIAGKANLSSINHRSGVGTAVTVSGGAGFGGSSSINTGTGGVNATGTIGIGFGFNITSGFSAYNQILDCEYEGAGCE